MTRALVACLVLALGGPAAGAEDGAGLRRAEGLVMLDYQAIDVAGAESIDLFGLHILHRLVDGAYVGVGVHAPLFNGAYGGFMAFDATAHLQRRLWGPLFANAGVSLGGGGGGKDIEQSKRLSGTGGFVKAYAGLGLDLSGVALGANVSRVKFVDSAIDHTQLGVFVQVPFGTTVGAYAASGGQVGAAEANALDGAGSESVLTLGLDNFVQINPRGSRKDTVRVADLQYAHHLTPSLYWYASLGVGWRGLPLYNQFIGGLGHRWRLAQHVNLHAQLGVGSGGYAPDIIDTGPGLLVYPKVSAEFVLSESLSASVGAGYLFAPKGSSKNRTFAAALNYRIRSGGADEAAPGQRLTLRGYRFSLFPQSDVNLNYRGIDRPRTDLLSGQLDSIVSDHVYIPVKGSIAYTAYLGYPGYGELLAGVGLQTRHLKGDRTQFFGQVLGGANVHGLLLQVGAGLNVALGDAIALYATAGKTYGTPSDDKNFRADFFGVGVTYRFSVPSR